jgi:4-amino-4-deoxy-L-arabinose transferase-like glycosyltransferase
MLRFSVLPSGIAAVVAFVLAAVMVNHGLVDSRLPVGPGLTLDESINLEQGVYLADAIGQHGPLLLTPSVAKQVFGVDRYLSDYPPLGRMLLGLTHQLTGWLIPGSESTAYNVPAARLGSCLAFAATVFLIAEFSRRRYGMVTGLCAALMLIGMPNVIGHARLASLESATNLAWVAAMLPLLAWWTKEKPPTVVQTIVSGLLWGILLLTKVQGLFLPVIVFLWAVWQFRWQAIRPLAVYGFTGAVVFFAGWPWLWLDPVANVLQYLSRTTDRSTLYCWYFGQRYTDKAVPWHFPFVMTLISLPAWTVVGLLIRAAKKSFDRTEHLLLLCILFPLIVFAVPGVPVYDGTRLFLIVMPPMAMLAGRGFALWLAARRPLQTLPTSPLSTESLSTATGTVRAAWQVVVCWALISIAPLFWILQPLAISQYGVLAGGNRGAAWMGMEAGYWSDALNSDFWSQVPEDCDLLVAPVSYQFQLNAIEALVPIVQQRRIRLTAFQYDPAGQTGNLLLIHRLADLRPELAIVPPGATVIAEASDSGVVYARVIDTLPPSKPQPD